jgi:hypothetical protein
MRKLQLLCLAVVTIACGDKIAGLKPPQAKNAFIKATTTISKLVVFPGDTFRFYFSIENITGDSLTLSTAIGCLIYPQLDKVAGPRQVPLFTDAFACPNTPTVMHLAAGEVLTLSALLRGFDPNVDILFQKPGYVLKPGTIDASVYVRADQIGDVTSDWVRFVVK